MKKTIFLLALALGLGLSPVQAQYSRKIKLSSVKLGFDLPASYKSRTFIKGLAGFVNNIDQLVGSMVIIDDNKTSVLTRFVKEGKPPIITTSTSDVIYSSKVNSKFRFNGAYCIASTKIGRDAIYELVITDIAVAFLPEDYIPYIEICKASNNVSDEVKQKTHYIRSAKLTTVYTRAYQKVDAETNISGVAFSVDGEVYASSDQFKVDYIVSVDIVSLEKLLSLHNCQQLVASDELARREQAERARLEAQKAEESKKSKENELAAAKAQVEELRRLLGQSVETNAELQREIGEAQEKERRALEQYEQAQREAARLALQADRDQAASDQQENMIVTFKNKEGKVLEIKSLEELSNDKLQELGFDVEVLKKDSNGGEE
ncbi:MAG: hypothetical protein R2792_16790 [Saprospiraceae bacterium]|jgi:hypothetical protein